MTKLTKCVVACTVAGLLVAPSFAQWAGRGNGDLDRQQLQDGTCDNALGDCDGTGVGRRSTDERPWRTAQQDRLNQQALTMDELTEAEVTEVLYMRQEEKLARDVYVTLYETWLADVFDTIAVSEQRHMDAIGRIITAQELDDPAADDTVGTFTDSVFSELFTELTGKGEVSYVEALRVGAYIEELDILDLAEALMVVENEYLAKVLGNLMRGSRNHLRAFVAHLEAEGETYTPALMSLEQYDENISGPIERGAGKGRRQAN